MRDVDAHELDKVWTTADLESLPRGETMWNPFAVLILAGNQRAERLGRQWVELHDGHQDGRPPKVDTSDDPLANILAEASLRRSGVRIVKNDAGEVAAVFPSVPVNPTRQQEDEWEARCAVMHDNQTVIDQPDFPEDPYPPPEKPSRPSYHGLMSGPDEPIKFEDWIKTQGR